MNPEIEKLVEMAFVDGQVNDKEREIILRKAEKLGLDVDEVEMYVEGRISSFNMDTKLSNQSLTNKEEDGNLNDSKENIDINTKIKSSYIETDDLKKIVENISSFEKKIIEIERFYVDNINIWINNEFLEIIKNHPKKIVLEELKLLMNASSFLSGKKYKEGRICNFIESIINSEDFIGYFALDSSLIPINTITSNNSFNDNYMRLLFTKKSVYFFDKNNFDIINNIFICAGVEYESIKSPEIYNLNIFNCSKNEVIHKLIFDTSDCNHNDVMKKNGIEWTDKSYKLDFLGENIVNSFCFLHLFSLNNLNKISFDEILINFKTEINYNQFKSVLKTHNLSEIQISNLQKINSYVDNFLLNFNSFITNKDHSLYYYDYLTKSDPYSFTVDKFNLKLGHSICIPKFNDELERVINFYKYTMTHVIIILDLRDKLLNFYLTNNYVDANEIFLKIDNYGVFLTKFERTSIEKLEQINTSINQLNNTLIDGFSMISDAIGSLNYNLDNIKNSIDKVESTLSVGNFINIIQTYQMYKINKNTKPNKLN